MEKRRNDILQLLKQNKVISGETIANSLHISRTAVWKHIQILQKKGYKITAIRQKGYQLQRLPDLPIEEIQQQLKTTYIGKPIRSFPDLPSTNDYLKHLAKKDHPEGTIVIAERQTMGRGRRQRSWSSPKGGLWFSLLLRPPFPPQKAMIVTMAVSIAITKAIHATTGIPLKIKWPNDILYKEKKICGVLTELSAEMDQITFMIIGIGINVNNPLPLDLQPTATSLRQICSKKIPYTDLFLSLISSLDEWYGYVKQQDETIIRETWLSLSDTIDKNVKITDGSSIITGVARGITEQGGLILETTEGTKQIVTGDISYL